MSNKLSNGQKDGRKDEGRLVTMRLLQLLFHSNTTQRAGRPGLDSQEVQGPFSTLPLQDRIWGPPSLLHEVYQGNSLSGDKEAGE